MSDGPRRDGRIEQTLTFHLLTAVNRITQPFHDRYGAPHDLSLPEWRCMMALASEPQVSGEDVARKMAMDKMTVSRSLRRLEGKGRVRRDPDPANRRRNRWELTQEGWNLFDRIMPEALERDRAAFGALPEEERARFIRILSELTID